MEWLLIWRTMDFSHLEQENNVGRPETGSFIYQYYKMKFFITFSGHNKTMSVISDTCHTQSPHSVCPLQTFLTSNPTFTVVVCSEQTRIV